MTEVDPVGVPDDELHDVPNGDGAGAKRPQRRQLGHSGRPSSRPSSCPGSPDCPGCLDDLLGSACSPIAYGEVRVRTKPQKFQPVANHEVIHDRYRYRCRYRSSRAAPGSRKAIAAASSLPLDES